MKQDNRVFDLEIERERDAVKESDKERLTLRHRTQIKR